jgi:hypothetical protein
LVSLFAERLDICGADVSEVLETSQPEIVRLVQAFVLQPVTPASTFEFEKCLSEQLRETGRRVMEVVLNQIEPSAAQMPKQIESENYAYSRKNEKTRNRSGIGTTFGTIELSRCSYEPLREGREDRQRSISPLELSLGIVAQNATPALAERVGRTAGDRTQNELLEMLQQDHGISWSVEVLRQVTSAVSEGVSEHLNWAQQQILLRYLEQANASRGRRKITLSVGRDGIMLPIRGETKYKEAAVATVAVYDRRGHRVGTIYLGQMPQAQQTALSDDLTGILTSVLQAWEGPMPRLVYVTDAGHHPTEYFNNVLMCMENPRQPGQTLEWTRVVDFYHACEYIAKLSQVLFEEDERAALGWQHRMRHKLKHDPNAVFSILHSAAKYRSERVLTAKQDKEYQKAYQYLHSHKEFMQYDRYRKQALPIGSGVTEAACKTVFTQRFKQSGMKWGLEGGTVILRLRLANLSHTWDAAYRAALLHNQPSTIITKLPQSQLTRPIAA